MSSATTNLDVVSVHDGLLWSFEIHERLIDIVNLVCGGFVSHASQESLNKEEAPV